MLRVDVRLGGVVDTAVLRWEPIIGGGVTMFEVRLAAWSLGMVWYGLAWCGRRLFVRRGLSTRLGLICWKEIYRAAVCRWC